MWINPIKRKQRTMDTQKEVKIQIPEGYEIDKENSTFEKIVFKKKEPIVNCWEDLENIRGVYIDYVSNIQECESGSDDNNRNIFLNEKYAKSALALAQISQLLPYYDANVNWDSFVNKYCIVRVRRDLTVNVLQSTYNILAFNTREEAERFLENNEQLVKDYLMID